MAMDYVDSMLDLVGNTPLVRLHRVLDGVPDDGPMVLAKVEYLNPGGSVKDRIAVRMVEAAEESGELQPGGTIVEPTSGNTGVGLALVAQAEGLPLRLRGPRQGQRGQAQRPQGVRRRGGRLPDRGRPRPPRLLLQRLGPADPRDRGRLEARPVLQPAQPALALRGRPGPEIWRQTEGRITHFVSGIGTGGTISGVGRYLKEQNPDVQVVGADPAGSVYSGGTGRPYLVEGVGEDFWPDDVRPATSPTGSSRSPTPTRSR